MILVSAPVNRLELLGEPCIMVVGHVWCLIVFISLAYQPL